MRVPVCHRCDPENFGGNKLDDRDKPAAGFRSFGRNGGFQFYFNWPKDVEHNRDTSLDPPIDFVFNIHKRATPTWASTSSTTGSTSKSW